MDRRRVGHWGAMARVCVSAVFAAVLWSGSEPLSADILIQAENYSSATDADGGNNGGEYRTDYDVDMEIAFDTNGGVNVGWTNAGETLTYDSVLFEAATYTIVARFANGCGGPSGSFKVQIDGVDRATVTMGNTGGWQTWQTTSAVTVGSVSAGLHSVKMVCQSGCFNLNWFKFVGGTNPSCTATTERLSNSGLARALGGGGFCQSAANAFSGWSLSNGSTWYDEDKLKANSYGCGNPARPIIQQTNVTVSAGACYTLSVSVRTDHYMPSGGSSWQQAWGVVKATFRSASNAVTGVQWLGPHTPSSQGGAGQTFTMSGIVPPNSTKVDILCQAGARQYSGGYNFTDIDFVSLKSELAGDTTPPTISSITVSPSCVATNGTVTVNATVLDNSGGSGVTQSGISLFGANLLTNPSFESDLAGWTNVSVPAYKINGTYAQPSSAKDGVKYASADCGYASGLKTPELRQTFGTTAGQKYYFSTWFWNDGSPNVCSGYLQYRQGADPGADGQGTTLASVTTATTGWQFLSGFVTATGSQLTLILRLSWDCGGAGGAGHFDLVEARQCVAPTSYNTGTGAAQWTGVTISAAMFNGQTSGALTIRATDTAGNSAQASSPTVTLDDAPPSTAVTNTPPTYTNAAIPINWTATDNGCNGTIGVGSVKLYVRPSGGSWADSGFAGQSGGSGSFGYTPGTDGLYYFQVIAGDGLGNAMTAPSGSSGTGQASSTYDATPPSPAQPQSTSAAASGITVNFGASSGDNLSGLSATPYQVTGSDSYNSGLVAGLSATDSSLPSAGTVVTYTVKTWDIAGNQASQTITGRVPPVDTGNAAVFSTQASTLAPPGLYPNSGKVFASSNGVLYGFNSATPAQLWAPISTGGSVQGRMPVATLNSTLTVLAGSQDGKIYARNAATGAEVWTHDLGAGYMATAKPAGALNRTVGAYSGDVVFAASHKNDDTNFLRAIRADTGATLWTYQPGNLGPIAGAPAVKLSGTGGTVFIASQTSTATGRVAAVNIADGSEVWQSQIGSVTSSVGVKDDGMKVFAVTDGGSLYSLDAATGATDGGYPLSVGTQPIYGAPFHVPNQNAVLVSLNSDNAVKMVSLAGPSVSWTKVLTAPSASLEYRGKVYVGSSDGKLYELNIADGTESSSRTIGYIVGDPVVDAINSVLYVGANDGRIYSFSLPF